MNAGFIFIEARKKKAMAIGEKKEGRAPKRTNLCVDLEKTKGGGPLGISMM